LETVVVDPADGSAMSKKVLQSSSASSSSASSVRGGANAFGGVFAKEGIQNSFSSDASVGIVVSIERMERMFSGRRELTLAFGDFRRALKRCQ